MDAKSKSYKAALTKLNAYIKTHNMRKTPVREIILEQVCLLPQPFTAEQLTQACKEEHISTGTIYNTLDLLIEAQLLNAVNHQCGKNAMQYELIQGRQIRMQIRCTQCGRVTEIRDKAIDNLIRIRKYSNFEMQRYSLFIYGECKHCRKTKKEEA